MRQAGYGPSLGPRPWPWPTTPARPAGVIIYGGSSGLEGCKVFLINGFGFPHLICLCVCACVCVCVCVTARAPKESQTADSPGVATASLPPFLSGGGGKGGREKVRETERRERENSERQREERKRERDHK